jgi:hypothetical protein
MALDGSSSDPTLRHALGERPFGPDVLPTLSGRAVVTLSDGSGRATALELRAFNNDNTAIPPQLFISIEGSRQDVVEVASASGHLGFFVLLVLAGPDASSRFELRQPKQTAQLARAQALFEIGDDPVAQLFSLAEDDDWSEISLILQAQLFRRGTLLHQLRVLASAHRDGVQNAVDTVQTKRLDFQEEPKETTIAGALMALVIEVAIVAFPAAFAGRILLRLASAVFMLTGVARVIGRKGAGPAFVERIASRRRLKALSRELNRPRLSRAEQQEIPRLEQERRKARQSSEQSARKIEGVRKEIKEVVLEAREKAKPVVAKFQGSPALTEPATYLVEKAAGAAGQASTASADLRPGEAKNLGPVHVPIDIAMKMQVQDFFEDWLVTVEEGSFLLERMIDVVETSRTLPATAFPVLDDILMSEAEAAALEKILVEDTDDVGALRANLETEYELLTWVLKYYNDFEKGTERKVVAGARHPPFEVDTIPSGVDRRLLRYLALRFLPATVRESSGKDDPDLLATYNAMHAVALQIKSLTEEAKPTDKRDPVVLDILREIRIARKKI